MSETNTETEAEIEAGVVVDTADKADELSAEDKTLMERARRMGWRPKDQYSGDTSRWVDFKEFVERGDNELPILRERFRKLDTRLAGTETRLVETEKRLKESTEVLIELRDMSRVAETRGYERAVQDLRAREYKAVQEADTAAYAAIMQEKEALERSRPPAAASPPPPPPAAAPPQTNPVIDNWVNANPWFKTYPTLNSYAMEMDREIEGEHPDWLLEDKLAEVRRRVVAKFPEKFENHRRAAPAAVTTSSAAPPRSKGKTVKDLPPDARAALEKFKKTIPGYKEEEYLKMYFVEEN